MRFTSTILLLATAVIVPSPSIAKVSTIRKRSRVYNRVRGRHLNGDGTVVNKNQSNIPKARARRDTETSAPESPQSQSDKEVLST